MDADVLEDDPGVQMRDAGLMGDIATIARLTESGVDLDEADDDGLTALHGAAIANNVKAVRFLVRAGADVDVRDNVGDTPLLYATLRGHLDVVEELARAGADLLLAGQDGKHAGEVAERQGMDAIVRFFRGQGLIGNLNLGKGTMKEGPLHVADSSSGDKWQQRHFVLSVTYKALFFWAGTRLDIGGVVAKIPLASFYRLHRNIGGNKRRINVVVCTGRVLPLLAASEADAEEWFRELKKWGGPHVAAFAIQTAFARFLGKRVATRRRRHVQHALRAFRTGGHDVSGAGELFVSKKRLGIQRRHWAKRWMVLNRAAGEFQLYKSKAKFSVGDKPKKVVPFEDFGSVGMDDDSLALLISLKQDKPNVVIRVDSDMDLEKWALALQTVCAGSHLAAVLMQSAFRMYLAEERLPLVRSRVAAERMSAKFHVPTFLLHDAATRIKRAWRNAVWAVMTRKSLFGRRAAAPVPSAATPRTPPTAARARSLTDVDADRIGAAGASSSSLAGTGRSAMFRDADDWFDHQLKALKFDAIEPKEPLEHTPSPLESATGVRDAVSPLSRTSSKSPGPDPASETVKEELIDKMIELMKLDLLRRMTRKAPSTAELARKRSATDGDVPSTNGTPSDLPPVSAASESKSTPKSKSKRPGLTVITNMSLLPIPEDEEKGRHDAGHDSDHSGTAASGVDEEAEETKTAPTAMAVAAAAAAVSPSTSSTAASTPDGKKSVAKPGADGWEQSNFLSKPGESPAEVVALPTREVLRRWLGHCTGHDVRIPLPAMPDLRRGASARRVTVTGTPRDLKVPAKPKKSGGLFSFLKRNRTSSADKPKPTPKKPPKVPSVKSTAAAKKPSSGDTKPVNIQSWEPTTERKWATKSSLKAANDWANRLKSRGTTSKGLSGLHSRTESAGARTGAGVGAGAGAGAGRATASKPWASRLRTKTSTGPVRPGRQPVKAPGGGGDSSDEEGEESSEEDEDDAAGGGASGSADDWEDIMQGGKIVYKNKRTGEVSTVPPWKRR